MNFKEFLRLFEAYFEGTLGKDEACQLAEVLRQDEAQRARFLHELQMANMLAHATGDGDDADEFIRSFWERLRAEETGDQFASDFEKRKSQADRTACEIRPKDLWEAVERDERLSLGRAAMEARVEAEIRRETIREAAQAALDRFLVEERRRQQELAYKLYRARRRRLIAGAGALAVLLIIVMATWLMQARPQRPAPPSVAVPIVVAHVTRSVDARWSQAQQPVEPGTPLTTSSMFLTQGLVELAFGNGTRVIIQAPADLRLESFDQMFLSSGALCARIAEGSSGFIVRTPIGTVVDYGTEFGALVNRRGMTEVHVYEGEVGLRSGSDPVRAVASRMLKEGQAAAVDVSGRIVSRAFRPRQVIREMPEAAAFGIPGKRFDLADALVGGNGFGTGDPNLGLDIMTGTTAHARLDGPDFRARRLGGVSVSSLPFVDFVFGVDNQLGPIRVSSAGHEFVECPQTDGKVAVPYIWGGTFPRLPGRQIDGELVLGGRRYGTRAMPAISIHANAGVTFDLQAIRDGLFDMRIGQFTALCGLSELAATAKLQETGSVSEGRADFWVLVDGQVRFSRRGVQIRSGAATVTVSLTDADRFLSLVVTDGGDGYNYDWGAFVEPAIELSANKS